MSVDDAAAAANTLWLSLASLIVGLLVGLLLAIAREAKVAALGAVVRFYLWLFRGTPVLLQIVFAFNAPSASSCRATPARFWPWG